MVFIIGVVLFALGIGLSVALHEAGHMFTAKWFGMKVRRYYIGFGPKIFSFRRGETEYGLKAIPAGGFCDIAGMTALDEVTPAEEPRAMWRYPAWKRVVVLGAHGVSNGQSDDAQGQLEHGAPPRPRTRASRSSCPTPRRRRSR